jgi:hypothetical protein
MDKAEKATISLSIISLLIISLFALIFFSSVDSASTQSSGTTVSGILTSDTIWNQANSPYMLTGAVGVSIGVTLTIEAGAKVNLGSNYILVNGTIAAKGSSPLPIQINGGEIRFTHLSSNFSEQTGIGSIIEYSILNSTHVIIENSSPRINNNDFRNSGLSIGGGASLVSNNVFLVSMQNNNAIDIGDSNATISFNKIAGAYAALTISSTKFIPMIENNLIIGNRQGFRMTSQFHSPSVTPIIRNNTITQNYVGLFFEKMGGPSPFPTIINNNIYGNTNLNIDLSGSGVFGVPDNVIANNNWWGTTNAQAINQTIFDYKNDFNLGNVSFAPFLSEPNANAPIVQNYTIQASSETGGSISPSGTVSISYGCSQEFTATPNQGYKVSNVLIDGVPASLGYTFGSGNSGPASCTIWNIISDGHTVLATFDSTLTPSPTPAPTQSHTTSPTQAPTSQPTANQNNSPTQNPTVNPTIAPTANPTPTSTVSEFPAIFAITFLTMTALVAAIVLKRKHLTES